MALIQIDNVSKIINKNTVLDNISLTMESGKIYGIQGINGSGKTMLMRIIIGLIRPSEGNISIDGNIIGKDIEFPKSIGFLLENPAFIDSYSGLDNLKMIASIKKNVTDEAIEKIIEKVGLSDAKNKKYKKYSLGMKQRLGIAAAVMENPDVVILDEPTNALDTSGIEMVKEITKELKEKNILTILSCHDKDILMELSDEIYKMDAGRIVEHCTVQE